jgi:hypothetical protein
MAPALFDPDISDMLNVAIEKHGNIAQIAKHYNVSRDTVYVYLQRVEKGKEIIDLVRRYNSDADLDSAEFIFRYNMLNYKNNPGLAQRAAEKVIDRKGWMRGWKDEEDKLQDIPEVLQKQFEATMNQLSSLQSERKIAESNINNDAKS